LDSAVALQTFSILHQNELPRCASTTNTKTVDGNIITTFNSTDLTFDGTSTSIVLYNRSNLRYLEYYELTQVPVCCPQINSWQEIAKACHFLRRNLL
jgi:hypothetical protein